MDMDMTPASAPVQTSEGTTSGTTDKTGETVSPQHSNVEEAVFFDDLGEKGRKKPDDDEESKGEKKDVLPPKAEAALKAGDKKESKVEKKDEKPAPKEPGKKEETAKLEAKKIKAKRGDAELDLEEDIVFSVPVNGKDEPVSLKDLRENYSGKVAWDKKFSEGDRVQREFQKKTDFLETKIKSIFEEKDPEVRMYRMAELSGKNPLEVRKQFLHDNLQILEKYYSMTEDERKQADLEAENRYLKHQHETQRQTDSLRQTQVELEKKVDSLRATHQIGKDEFADRYSLLETLVKEGKLENDKINPDFIAETILKDRLWASVSDAAKEMQIELGDAGNKKIADLIEISFAQGLKPSDMKDIVSELWGTKKIQKAVKEKEEARTEFISGSQKKPASKPSGDIWSFDQL